MNQEKVFFQFSMGNNKLKDIIEMQKIYYKNSYKKYRITLLIIALLLFIDQLLKSIYRYDLSILNAIIIYFTDVRWLVLDCLIFIFMFKIIEVVWCTRYIVSKLKKIILPKKLSTFITFYESYCIITYYSSTQVYEEYIIYYSDIKNYLTTSNLIIIKLITREYIVPIIRKDSIENIDDFINFLNEKISK